MGREVCAHLLPTDDFCAACAHDALGGPAWSDESSAAAEKLEKWIDAVSNDHVREDQELRFCLFSLARAHYRLGAEIVRALGRIEKRLANKNS